MLQDLLPPPQAVSQRQSELTCQEQLPIIARSDSLLLSETGVLMMLCSTHQLGPDQACEQDMDQVWSLLLQHPALSTDSSSICRLLCVSKGMLQTVQDRLAGQLQLTVSAEQEGQSKVGASLRSWLSSHAPLLRSFHFKQLSGLECSRPEEQQQATHVAAGFKAAAGRTEPLQLSSFGSNICSKLLLESLLVMSTSLTRLELGPYCTDELSKHLSTAARPTATTSAHSTMAAPAGSHHWQPSAGTRAQLQQPSAGTPSCPPLHCSSVLASLPALSSLTLHGHAANILLPSVQSCTQLRSLALNNLLCSKAHMLNTLPPQLQELQVSVDSDFTSWQRKQRQPVLSHLTDLTRLSCTGEGLFAVQAEEVLPPRLVHLVVSDSPKAQPLLALTGLQVLVMQGSTMSAQQLTQLPVALQSLREVHLGYDRGNMEAITAAAPGWPSLQGLIKGLDLKVYPGPLPAQTLTHLAQLGAGLTRLAISGFSVQVDATPAVFAAALGALPGLQELKLAYLVFKHEQLHQGGYAGEHNAAAGHVLGPRAVGAGAGAMAAAPAGPAEAAAGAATAGVHASGLVVLMQQIASLPALSSLSLHSMSLRGGPIAALAGASHLTALQLNECEVCDADVAMLAAGLAGLRRLALNWNFDVKSEGLACLTLLKGLRELHVCCGTTRHEAALAGLQQQMPRLATFS